MTLTTAFGNLCNLGFENVIMTLFLLIILAVAFMETMKKLFDYLGLQTKSKIKEIELNKKIKEMQKNIEDLQGSASKFNKDRVSDREQSFKIQNSLTASIDAIAETQKELIKKIDDLTEQNRKYELADMRETLLQAYRYYTNPTQNKMLAWSSMEAHAFWEQYDVYVERGGNGYMHDTVKPEMLKLVEIPLNDSEKIAELMASRS